MKRLIFDPAFRYRMADLERVISEPDVIVPQVWQEWQIMVAACGCKYLVHLRSLGQYRVTWAGSLIGSGLPPIKELCDYEYEEVLDPVSDATSATLESWAFPGGSLHIKAEHAFGYSPLSDPTSAYDLHAKPAPKPKVRPSLDVASQPWRDAVGKVVKWRPRTLSAGWTTDRVHAVSPDGFVTLRCLAGDLIWDARYVELVEVLPGDAP